MDEGERKMWRELRRRLEEAVREVVAATDRIRREQFDELRRTCGELDEARRREAERAEEEARRLRLELLERLASGFEPSQQLLAPPELGGEEACRAILDLAERLSLEDLRQVVEDLKALLREREGRRAKA
jgi:dTMP kinase